MPRGRKSELDVMLVYTVQSTDLTVENFHAIFHDDQATTELNPYRQAEKELKSLERKFSRNPDKWIHTWHICYLVESSENYKTIKQRNHG